MYLKGQVISQELLVGRLALVYDKSEAPTCCRWTSWTLAKKVHDLANLALFFPPPVLRFIFLVNWYQGNKPRQRAWLVSWGPAGRRTKSELYEAEVHAHSGWQGLAGESRSLRPTKGGTDGFIT